MKSFFVFLAVITVIGLVWAFAPVLERREGAQEERLIAALNLVENAVVTSSSDILRVDLFSPRIDALEGDGRWRLSGIIETQGRAAKPVHARYAADISFVCVPYADVRCGKIELLSIEGQPLVVDGAVVTELQLVLDAAAGTSTTAPASAAGTPTLPPLQMSPAASTSPAMPEATPAPGAETIVPPSDESKAPTAAAAPTMAEVAASAAGTESYQGDRLIYLIQKRLREMGLDPGPVDGRVGPRTTSAIQAYQQQAGLGIDGQPSEALLQHMLRSTGATTQ